ncbi:MCAT [Symbiodinium natans]|uniref:MCAT protein n=1 Tax=Symbiodinium natans TaxID=878477 RepID=A0A812IKK5_9DINO|nr:MCAT [Symbiodinium natans]
MKPAQERLQAKLREFLPRMSRPRCTVLMGARPIDRHTHPEIVLELLGEDLALPVRWKDTVEALGRCGLEDIFECGPSKELKASMKRIDNDIWSRTCNVEV